MAALADLTDPAQPGVTIIAGQQLPGFAWLRDGGTTLCGNWLYSGSWTEAGAQSQRRGTEDPSGLGIYPNGAWSWPERLSSRSLIHGAQTRMTEIIESAY